MSSIAIPNTNSTSLDTQQEIDSSNSQEELWNIIEKQRDIIHELQEELNKVTIERDHLIAKSKVPADHTPTNSLSCSSSSASSSIVEDTTLPQINSNTLPIPPPRSPYRSTNNNIIETDTQQQQKTVPLPPLPPLPNKNALPLSERQSSLANLDDRRSDDLNDDQDLVPIQLKVLEQNADSFILSIMNKTNKQEIYQIEKLFTDLLLLDMTLKSNSNNDSISLDFLFSGTVKSLNKIEQYLKNLIDDSNSSLIYSFISSSGNKQKQGYLTKRGKYSGGFKKYFFIMNEFQLNYFCTRNGQLFMGNILLVSETRIGRQQQQTIANTEEVIQHAFVILLESATVVGYKHILCAISDSERDEWVKLLHAQCSSSTAPRVNPQISKKKSATSSNKKSGRSTSPKYSYMIRANSDASMNPLEKPTSNSHTIGALPSAATAGPIIRRKTYQRSSMDDQAILRYHNESNNSKLLYDQQQQQQQNLSPKASADSLPNLTDNISNKDKKTVPSQRKSFFWSRKKLFTNNAIDSAFSALDDDLIVEQEKVASYDNSKASSTSTIATTIANNTNSIYPVFGVSLEETLKTVDNLPTIVYRCIEYLESKDAVHEEGIYRLSGSSVKVNLLRNQFCDSGDMDLLIRKDIDVHVVAGLLKLWLRELPVNVLTRELFDDFINVIDVKDTQARVKKLGQLVSLLPNSNYSLLRVLIAHLIRIVQHAEYNKMTLRNVSIVFAPTLSIPSFVFTLLMKEFDSIFGGGGADNKKKKAASSNKSSSKSIKNSNNSKAAKATAMVYPEPSTSADRIKLQYLKKAEQEFAGGSSENNVNYNEGKYHHRGELILEEEDQGYHQQQQNSRIEKEKNEAKVMMLSSALNYNKEIL